MAGNQDRPLEEEHHIVRIVHALLQRAICDGATELRVSSGMRLDGGWSPLLIQSLIDGIWSVLPSMPQLPGVLSGNIMRRFKILADVNPFSSKGPQEGSFRISVETGGSQRNDYLIYASFREGPEGITTEMSIQEAQS